MDDKKPFERISLAELRQGRRGKHHKLVTKVIHELKGTPSGEALQIPLSALKGISTSDFRSAIDRGASSAKLKISTYSDLENVYVWVRSSKTGRYERKRGKD